MNNTIKLIGTFDNVYVRSNNQATIRFKIPFSQVVRYVELVTVLGQQFLCKVRSDGNQDDVRMGYVSIKQIIIDRDGECKLTLLGDVESMDIGRLHTMSEDAVTIMIKGGA